MVKNENYIVIQGWMVNELKLKGNELIVFAIIYGFSQDGLNKFDGSLKYLEEWTNTSKQSIITILKSLVTKNLIVKEEMIKNGVRFCKYYSKIGVVKKFDQGSKNLTGVVKKFDQGWSKNFTGGGQETLPNNIKDNIEDNIVYIIDKKPKNPSKPLNDNQIPTPEEVTKYLAGLGLKIRHVEYFMNYYNASNWCDKAGLPINWMQKAQGWAMREKPTQEDIEQDLKKKQDEYDAKMEEIRQERKREKLEKEKEHMEYLKKLASKPCYNNYKKEWEEEE